MIYGTQDGWFPPITGPGPVMLVAYILVLYYVHVQLLCSVMCMYNIHNSNQFWCFYLRINK